MGAVRWAILGGALALGACGKDAAPPPPPAPAAPPAALPTPAAPITPAPVTRATPREAIAELVADAEDALAVSAPGVARIERVLVRPGDRVEAGAPLVTLLIPEATTAAARATAARDRLAVVEQRRAAVAELVATGLARAADVAELDARRAEIRGELTLAVAELRALGLGDGGGGRATLRAARPGVVMTVAATVGAVHAPTDGPLVTLAAGTARRVVAHWLEVPAGTATLRLADGTSRALTVAAVAPRRDDGGAVMIWYDVDGEPLTATTRARVVIEATP
ncbi:MAG: efflux RND transporter periplasmic adaptor subunit [Kofleriaceae bacterium]